MYTVTTCRFLLLEWRTLFTAEEGPRVRNVLYCYRLSKNYVINKALLVLHSKNLHVHVHYCNIPRL